MSRPLRPEHPGAHWHVTSRGNERRDIFRDDRDREVFLETLGSAVSMLRWRVFAWVLMSNHYHVLLETPEPNLSRGMRQLNGVYTQRFNRRHRRVGHLFQGRFKGIVVEKESHLLELSRYVVLNPVRANAVRSALEWRWSSYRATAGYSPAPEWFQPDHVLALFGRRRAVAQGRYREFVAEGIRSAYSPWESLDHQILLGSEGFVEEIRHRMDGGTPPGEIPRKQRNLSRPGLQAIAREAALAFEVPEETVRRKRGGRVRLAVASVARRLAASSLEEIGTYLDVRSWSASHMAAAAEKLAERDADFRARMAALLNRIGSTAI
jgi:REP element-mobilizing transposase RayT